MPQPSSVMRLSTTPPSRIGDGDAGGAGIQGVFDQLLDYRSRPLNDLAGRDLGGDVRRELLDGHGRSVANEAETDEVIFRPSGLCLDDAAQYRKPESSAATVPGYCNLALSGFVEIMAVAAR